jgi:hypothetical protein
MVADWIAVCTSRQTDWNIPVPALMELTVRRDAAQAALEIAENEINRTPVSTAWCKEAFDALTDFMRDFERWYFMTPLLLDSDLISLGLKPCDEHPASGDVPAARMAGDLTGGPPRGVRITFVTGSPDNKANKGYRIWYSVIAPGEKPPSKPEELCTSFYTQRKKDQIEFEYEDSGSTVYFAVQVENDGTQGVWGPMVSAFIP